jgi:hypothetical protein
MNSLPLRAAMDRAANSEDELQILRILCDEAASRKRRLELLQFLQGHVFRDPEDQVVFESVRFLLSRGAVSADRLAVHLNNRGFPDINMEKYFPAASASAALEEEV